MLVAFLVTLLVMRSLVVFTLPLMLMTVILTKNRMTSINFRLRERLTVTLDIVMAVILPQHGVLSRRHRSRHRSRMRRMGLIGVLDGRMGLGLIIHGSEMIRTAKHWMFRLTQDNPTD